MDSIDSNARRDVIKLMVATKSDLRKQRVIETEEAQALANRFNFDFIETSAKLNLNVTEAFESVARIHVKRQIEAQKEKLSNQDTFLFNSEHSKLSVMVPLDQRNSIRLTNRSFLMPKPSVKKSRGCC